MGAAELSWGHCPGVSLELHCPQALAPQSPSGVRVPAKSLRAHSRLHSPKRSCCVVPIVDLGLRFP